MLTPLIQTGGRDNYTADPNAPEGEANAPDLISGTAGNDVILGDGANDSNYEILLERRLAA